MIGYETYQRIKLLSESDRMSVTQMADRGQFYYLIITKRKGRIGVSSIIL